MAAFLTLEEAADRLGVEYKTVYRLVRSGELPAGKVGRIYRIREDDLHAYFERQKQLLVQQAQRTGLTALEGRRCGGCNQPILSELSVAGKCETCGGDLCQACWAIRKLRTCAAHAAGGAGADLPKAPVARPAAASALPPGPVTAETPAAAVARLRREGRPVVTVDEVRVAGENFIRAFAQRLEEIEELPDPLTRRSIALRKARVKHTLEPAADKGAAAPISRGSTFVLRSGGWGRPKAGLVLQARLVARDERLLAEGYDTDPLGEAELTPLLAQLREQARREDLFHAVVLGSPTGWDPAAARLVTDRTAGRGFRDRRVGIALYALPGEMTHVDMADERLREFWPLLAPAPFAAELQRCVQDVRALADKLSGLSLDHVVKSLGLPRGWVRAAFAELARTGRYGVEETTELGLLLARKQA